MTATTTCPSFTDLRAFAAQDRTPAADPFGAGRRPLPLRDGPVEAGTINLAAGHGTAAPLAGDWFLFAEQGSAVLTTAAGPIALTEGASCVLPAGTAFAWDTAAPATLVYMRHSQAAAGSPLLARIDLAAELVPSGAPLAELLVGETPSCRNSTQFRSADGLFSAGVWDSTPYHRRQMRYAHYELMALLEGSVTFVDEEGREGTFRQGDVFMVEAGAACSWDSREQVAKVWAIYRPLA